MNKGAGVAAGPVAKKKHQIDRYVYFSIGRKTAQFQGFGSTEKMNDQNKT